MIRWSPDLRYAYKLAKLSDDVDFKDGSSITQELGWCSKDQDISLPPKLSNSLCSLIRGNICHNVFCKMVKKDQVVHHIRGLIQLHHCLNAGNVNVQQLQRNTNNDGSHWSFGMSVFMLDAFLTVADCLLHPHGYSWQPEMLMEEVQHSLLNFWWNPSWPLLSEPWGLQITKFLQTYQWVYGDGRRLLGRVLVSSALRE